MSGNFETDEEFSMFGDCKPTYSLLERAMSDPIQNLESIDIIGQRRDGGVDLAIVVSAYLDATPEHELLLKQKVQNYVDAIFSAEFQAEYGELEAKQFAILIKCLEPPHPEILPLVDVLAARLAEFEISLVLEGGNA